MKNSHKELHKVAKQVGDHEHRTTQKQDSCTRSSAYRTTLCNIAASTEKSAVQWRFTDNAATNSGILAKNHTALTRKVTSCAYMVVNAVKSRDRLLHMTRKIGNSVFSTKPTNYYNLDVFISAWQR